MGAQSFQIRGMDASCVADKSSLRVSRHVILKDAFTVLTFLLGLILIGPLFVQFILLAPVNSLKNSFCWCKNCTQIKHAVRELGITTCADFYHLSNDQMLKLWLLYAKIRPLDFAGIIAFALVLLAGGLFPIFIALSRIIRWLFLPLDIAQTLELEIDQGSIKRLQLGSFKWWGTKILGMYFGPAATYSRLYFRQVEPDLYVGYLTGEIWIRIIRSQVESDQRILVDKRNLEKLLAFIREHVKDGEKKIIKKENGDVEIKLV